MLFASGVGTIGIAILTGGLAGGIVTGVIGPTLADRQGRYESYRKWQLDLSNEVLMKVAEIRMKLISNPGAAAPSDLVEELHLLAQRVDLIFVRHKKTPEAAEAIVAAARLEPPDLQGFDRARDQFVSCASDEIRSRGRWSRTRS